MIELFVPLFTESVWQRPRNSIACRIACGHKATGGFQFISDCGSPSANGYRIESFRYSAGTQAAFPGLAFGYGSCELNEIDPAVAEAANIILKILPFKTALQCSGFWDSIQALKAHTPQ